MAATPLVGASPSRPSRLPAHVNRILYIRNLPYKITSEEMYDIFGKFGAVRQIRLGQAGNPKTRGTAFVVYEDINDAATAQAKLTGFNVLGRYLSVLFYHKEKARTAKSLSAEQEELDKLKQQYRAARASAEKLAAEQEEAGL
ncbi:Sf3b6 [Symbiodinium sp. KB8]|nr:Sf3b6 [Symbiodinium sp. KB8]